MYKILIVYGIYNLYNLVDAHGSNNFMRSKQREANSHRALGFPKKSTMK